MTVTDNNALIATSDFLPYTDAVSEYRQFSLRIKALTDPKLTIQVRSYQATKLLEDYYKSFFKKHASPLTMDTQLELERLLLRPFKDDEEIERFYDLFQRTKQDIAETSKGCLHPTHLIEFLVACTKPKPAPKKAKAKQQVVATPIVPNGQTQVPKPKANNRESRNGLMPTSYTPLKTPLGLHEGW
eukprot:GHVH01009232.1.p1 GENE.GHVH01009232.1~~GHVH01009232.1.p1  ORF type:complete len:186 (-),score=15.82 GHVH01009232.1:22-579(-)